ncbi:arylsulfatase B-like [Thrips palmi]|uniref:Arylsulfatase B-like n=1 Tax=Thrips palmi TaxID=161013 RepID=A0A6P8ZHS0_THRPL|nr:arylsulfatase B-like [Thrips palmi]
MAVVTTRTLQQLFAVAVLAVLAVGRGRAAAPAARPNIVLMIADDLGYNDVSFRGSNQIQTPNIDALAYSGVVLNHHYVLPTCTPSRTAILTGQYPIRTGMQGYPLKAGEARGLPLKFRTLPERLAALGYRTNLVGKWHQGFHYADYTPTRRGFHHHLGYWNGYMSYFSHVVHMDSPHGLEEGRFGYDLHWNEKPARHYQGRYATHLFTERAENIIRDHEPADGPLYLQLAHLAAHAGLNGTELEVPDEAANDRRHGYIQDSHRRHLAGVIREMDLSVGRVVRALEQRGMLNNTIIVLMADNGGETLGIHSNHASNWPLRGQKWTLFEGGVRGAAVVWSPKLAKPGSIHEGMVHVTDWLPTFYQAAGGDLDDLGKIDGISQWDSLTQPAARFPRNEVLVNIDEGAALIQGDLKLVKGEQYRDLSGYLGVAGREAVNPAYDVDAVLQSEAAAALGSCTPPLTAALVRRLRAEASAPRLGVEAEACREGGAALNLTCSPYCLFDLRADPCEARDVRALHRGQGDLMLRRLAEWEALTVPQLNKDVDEAADPRRHNMTWVSWMDRSSSARPLPALLAALLIPVLAGARAA